jgi:hypothetical protein
LIEQTLSPTSYSSRSDWVRRVRDHHGLSGVGVDQLVPGCWVGEEEHLVVEVGEPVLDGPAVGECAGQLLLVERVLVSQDRVTVERVGQVDLIGAALAQQRVRVRVLEQLDQS